MKYLDFLKLYFDEGSDSGENGGTTGNDAGNKGSATDQNKGTDNNDNGGDDRNTPKYTDADLDKIIEKKLAKWKRQAKAEVDEATRLANMTAQERAEAERDKLQKELDDLKRANTLAEMEKTARSILKQDNIDVPDDIVAVLVDEDADTTDSRVKSFGKAFKKAVQEEVKRQLTHKTPSQGTGGKLTSADIMKEKDPKKRQELIRQNMNLFKH